MSVSKVFLKLFAVALFQLSAGCGTGEGNPSSPRYETYVICNDQTDASGKWAEYLYRHLSKRCGGKNVLITDSNTDAYEPGEGGLRKIRLEVDETIGYDYCVENNPGQLVIKAKEDRTMLWLIYQYMACLGEEDSRVSAEDIPPAVIRFENCRRNFDFEYREPFFSPNLSEDYPGIIGTNSLETDWGIWGHNLGKILGETGDPEVFARIGKRIDREQYCFSSDATFGHIRDYITDNYGPAPAMRFVIMPNDNMKVCTCENCVRLGNTGSSATPAVSFMIARLAGEFPSHNFFTSAYMTTLDVPAGKMPANAGVLVSTINLPKGIGLSRVAEAREFTKELSLWKSVTPNIYIWDYAANFDDYLTPVPVLYGLKKQLCYYKQAGVKGVFLNASGYDYSPYDDMKNYVAAALMIDHTLSVEELCAKYLSHFYPVSGNILAAYYLSLEERLKALELPYNIYGSFREALRTFLDADEFMLFYGALESLAATAEGPEKEKLRKLLTAMSFTRLQLAYTRGTGLYGFATLDRKRVELSPEILNAYGRLSEHVGYSDFNLYKESEGSLEDYMENWSSLMRRLPDENYLIGEELEILSPVDTDYINDTYLLNDGVRGFYGDYHQGWFLSGSDYLEVRFPAENAVRANTLSMRFLLHEKHKIYLPEKIEILKDGALYKTANPGKTHAGTSGINVARAEIGIDISDADYITLKIYKKADMPRSSIACDEIQLKYNEL